MIPPLIEEASLATTIVSQGLSEMLTYRDPAGETVPAEQDLDCVELLRPSLLFRYNEFERERLEMRQIVGFAVDRNLAKTTVGLFTFCHCDPCMIAQFTMELERCSYRARDSTITLRSSAIETGFRSEMLAPAAWAALLSSGVLWPDITMIGVDADLARA